MASTTHHVRWPMIAPDEALDRPVERPRVLARRSTANERGRDASADLEDLWPIDEEAEALWRARRGRRVLVRCAGWACVAGMVASAAELAGSSRARDEMLTWATMGRITTAPADVLAVLSSGLPAFAGRGQAVREPLAAISAEPDAGAALPIVEQDAGTRSLDVQDAGRLTHEAEDAGALRASVDDAGASASRASARRAVRPIVRSGSALRDARGGREARKPERDGRDTASAVAAGQAPIVDDPYGDDAAGAEKQDDSAADPYEP